MRKSRRLLTLALVLTMVLASVQIAAADISGDFGSEKPFDTTAAVTSTFDTKGDADAYCFYSGGKGSAYTLTVYSKDAYDTDPEFTAQFEDTLDDPYYNYEMPVEVAYGEYEKYSAIAGEKESYQIGPIRNTEELNVDGKDSSGWYYSKIDLGKIKKGTKVGIRITGAKKGKYKIKLSGPAVLNAGKTTLKNVTAGKKALTVKWDKAARASGYQVKYAVNKKFKNAKTVNVKKSVSKKKLTKLKSKKTYYVKVRAYKSVNGKKYYGPWSSTKKIKTK